MGFYTFYVENVKSNQVFAIAITTFAHEKSPPDSATNTYFIAFESKVDKNVIKTHSGEIKHQYKYMSVVAAKLPEKAVEALSKNPNIS